MPKYKKHPEGEHDVFCPIGYTIDNIIGKKWGLYIIRELYLKPKHFNELLRNLSWGLTPKILSLRIKELLKEGIINKEIEQTTPPKVKYSLTKKGKEFVKSFKTIEKWSKKWNIEIR